MSQTLHPRPRRRTATAVVALLVVILGAVAASAPGPVVRLLGSLPSGPVAVALLADDVDTAQQAARRADLPIVGALDAAGAVVVVATAEQVQAVRRDTTLDAVQVMPSIRWTAVSERYAVRGDEQSLVALEAAGVVAAAPTGQGVGVAIVDSGIDPNHPMFVGRVDRHLVTTCDDEQAAPAVPVLPCVVDVPTVADSDTAGGSGHGTAVAGIAVGSRTWTSDGRPMSGIAPEADLVLLSTGKAGSGIGAAHALQWLVDHHADPCGDGNCAPIRVVNNSYTTSDDSAADPDSVFMRLQRALVEAGVVVVWGAGNDGDVARTNPFGRTTLGGVLLVGGYDDLERGHRDGRRWELSSTGQPDAPETWPDLVAPADLVLSACRPWMVLCGADIIGGDQNYGLASGTSLSAPFVTGAVALLLEVAPDLTPTQVEALLRTTARELDEAEHAAGAGLLDVAAAVAAAVGQEAGPSDCLTHGPVVLDAPGDVFASLVQAVPVPDDALDILSLDLRWSADRVDVVIERAGDASDAITDAVPQRLQFVLLAGDVVHDVLLFLRDEPTGRLATATTTIPIDVRAEGASVIATIPRDLPTITDGAVDDLPSGAPVEIRRLQSGRTTEPGIYTSEADMARGQRCHPVVPAR